MTPGAPLVQVETRGPVLLVTLDRPAKRNAVSAKITAGLDEAFNRFEDDASLRVAVLAANGPVFCAGTDLTEGAGDPTSRGGEYGFIRRQRTKPVVAAVDGPALGGGFELVMACDLVVASTSASFSMPEASRGRVANAGGLFRTFDRLPRNLAIELLLASGQLGATRAYDLGFVNRLAERGSVLAEALLLAREICGSAPGSVVEAMAAVHALAAAGESAGWEATAHALARTIGSEDRAEGDRAFAEKRQPAWVLRPEGC